MRKLKNSNGLNMLKELMVPNRNRNPVCVRPNRSWGNFKAVWFTCWTLHCTCRDVCVCVCDEMKNERCDCRCEAISASDYIEFSNFMARDRKYARYCGQLKEFHVESERKFFRVTFRSNDRLDGTGFQAHYQFLDEVDLYTAKPPTRTPSGTPRPMPECLLFLLLVSFLMVGLQGQVAGRCWKRFLQSLLHCWFVATGQPLSSRVNRLWFLISGLGPRWISTCTAGSSGRGTTSLPDVRFSP